MPLRNNMFVENKNKLPADHELKLSNLGLKEPKGRAWPWEKRIEVVSKWLVLQNMRVVSEQTGVHYEVIKDWKNSDWWDDLVEQIKKTKELELDNKLSKIIDRSLAVVADRLENGDLILNNKTGELVRKPVSMKDSAKVASDLLAKQILIKEKSETVQIKKESVKEQLALLAQEFSKWNKRQLKNSATDAVIAKETHLAVHDQRETELQEGSGEVHLQTGSSEEADSSERS